jgi:hypothetical protein
MSCSDNSSDKEAVPCTMDGNMGNGDGQHEAPSVPWSRRVSLQELVRLLLLTDESPAQQPFEAIGGLELLDEEEEADAVLPWYVVSCRTSGGSGEQSNAFCSPVDTSMLAFGNMGWSRVVVALLLSSPLTASPSRTSGGITTIRDIIAGDAKKITIRRPRNLKIRWFWCLLECKCSKYNFFARMTRFRLELGILSTQQ